MTWQGHFDELDDETASLIIQLQREDVERLTRSSKGKQREGEISDADLALQLCMEELTLFAPFRADLQMARSVGTAVITDVALLNEESQLEHQASRDREMATRLLAQSDNDVPNLGSSTSSSEEEDFDDVTMAKVQAQNYVRMLDMRSQSVVQHHPKAESSAQAASRKAAYFDKSSRCVACSDDKPWFEVVTAPCGDEYCADCVSLLFETSMTDESLYPPRCCRQPIPLKSAKPFLRSGLAEDFADKSQELDTKDRTYCHAQDCSRFIPSVHINEEIGTCPGCSRRTCTTCKTAAHFGDCPNDTSLQQLLETANSEGWQRCYQCLRVVELDTGCNHMT